MVRNPRGLQSKCNRYGFRAHDPELNSRCIIQYQQYTETNRQDNPEPCCQLAANSNTSDGVSLDYAEAAHQNIYRTGQVDERPENHIAENP